MKITAQYIGKRWAILLILLVCSTSCKKFVEIDGPVDTVTAADAYATDDKTASVIRGLYVTMVKTTGFAFGGTVSVALGLSSDELAVSAATNNYNEFYINQVNPRGANVSDGLWGAMYNIIYATNQVIENVPNSPGMTPGAKVRALAEARFIRGVCFFYLTNMFGDVPLPLTSDFTVNAKISKSGTRQVYDQVISDLMFAEANLPASYSNTTRIHANRYAAAAMLARVYLYDKNWTAAAAAATRVIEGKDAANALLYELNPSLNNVFLVNSKEVILTLQSPGTNLFSWEGYVFQPSSATANPGYKLTDNLRNAFSADDQRLANWTRIQNGLTYPNKYKLGTGSGATKTESLAFLRLAEVYLIRAEARAESGDVPNAVSDLEKTRKRAGILTALDPNMTKANFLTELSNERFKELFSEQGHRWLDLKRWGTADAVLGSKPNWTPAAKWFPIPFNDVNVNPNLK